MIRRRSVGRSAHRSAKTYVEPLELRLMLASDFGDAPLSYGTSLSNGGAQHEVVSDLYLGSTVDTEDDGQPTSLANGDDLAGDDEDGVTIPTLTAGEQAGIGISVHVPVGVTSGRVFAFFDWNSDGDFFDSQEAVPSVGFGNGGGTLLVSVPSSAVPGQTYARFRLTDGITAGPVGSVVSGEVEDYRITILPGTDYGDAPASYDGPSFAQTNHARHSRLSGLYLGSGVDGELGYQPSVEANGDDLAGIDDDDGVTFPALIAGEPAGVSISVHVPASMSSSLGRVSAFFDWNADGDFFDVDETIPSSSLGIGGGTLVVNVPAAAVPGQTYARFRLTDGTTVGPTGSASAGEVEDYRITVLPGTDYGDAPASYDASDPARHQRRSGLYLGTQLDGELANLPTAGADGDDQANVDDEDGVTIPTLVPGEQASLGVTVHLPAFMPTGRVAAFFDWNGDGDFFDVDETVSPANFNNGGGTLLVNVPATAVPGQTYARFRLTDGISTGPVGQVLGGEVEDYRVTIVPGTDFGDAPATYDGSDHARHTRRSGLYLGSGVDGELDFQPGVEAQGDDLAGVDDDDGVTFPALVAGEQAGVAVSVHLPASMPTGRVAAFFDWNADGDFFDVNETISPANFNSAGGTLLVSVPATAVPGQTYARFRLTDGVSTGPVGQVLGGEVEDYRVTILPGTDFGDAPASYDGSDHARHTRRSGLYLGSGVDGEVDYQPSADASGDDLAGMDDDDGATIPALIPGEPASIMLSVHLPTDLPTGRVAAFFDWNADGDFTDSGETVFQNFMNGGGSLAVNVPPTAVPGQTYARFRLTDGVSTGPLGQVLGGEVEDYRVTILPGTDFGDAPASYDGTDHARHTRVSGMYLGTSIDGELDHQPSVNADGDDLAGIDDDDGVTIPQLIIGETATISVLVHLPSNMPSATVSAFFDWNISGTFLDEPSHFFQTVVNGLNTLTVPVPANAVSGETFARFRLSASSSDKVGQVFGGEVEDYRVAIVPVAWVEPGAQATWNPQSNTLTVTGPTTINSDPADNGVTQPTINASGPDADITIAAPSGDVHVGELNLSNGASVTLASLGQAGLSLRSSAVAEQVDAGFVLVVENELNIDATSKLDVGNNAMILRGSSLAAVQSLISTGYASAAWNGAGINSSTAANDPNFLGAVGYGSNADLYLSEFQGVVLGESDILVRYTLLGDCDLNGVVNLDDYPLFTAGLENKDLPQTWVYGDFDYNGDVNLDDFPLFTYGLENSDDQD